MKKVFVFILVLFMIIGCSNKADDKVPNKLSPTDNAANISPINSFNLDSYMNRNDIQYIDLRSGKMILDEGYVAGFNFVPYYSIIASFSEHTTLYQMKTTIDGNGETHYAGQVGGFVPQYEESQRIIESIFDKNKYIFLISQAGSESAYMINLLIQLGYDGNLLYNVGGVSNSEGPTPYKDVENNKYYVEGHSGFNPSVSYDFVSDLTPIN